MIPKFRHRTAFAMLALALLLAGSAGATTTVYVRAGPDGVTVHAHSDDVRVPRLPPNEPEPEPEPVRPAFEAKMHPPRQAVAPGAEARFLVILHANRDVTVDLAVANATRGFDAHLGQERVTLAAGQNATVNLTVATPGAEGRGFVHLNLSDGGRELRHLVAQVDVIEPRADLALAMDPARQNATAGESVTFRVVASSSLARNLTLNVTRLPPGWSAELEAREVRVGPDGKTVVNLTVHVPANATSGGAVGVAGFTERGERAYAEGYVLLPTDPRTMREPSR